MILSQDSYTQYFILLKENYMIRYKGVSAPSYSSANITIDFAFMNQSEKVSNDIWLTLNQCVSIYLTLAENALGGSSI